MAIPKGLVVGECRGDKRKRGSDSGEEADRLAAPPPVGAQTLDIATAPTDSQAGDGAVTKSSGAEAMPSSDIAGARVEEHLVAHSFRQAQLRKVRPLQALRAGPCSCGPYLLFEIF